MNTNPILYCSIHFTTLSLCAYCALRITCTHTTTHFDGISIAIFTCYQNTITILILLTYPLKPLRLLIGDAVVVAEFSVDNVKSVAGINTYTTKGRKRKEKRENKEKVRKHGK